MKQFSYVLSNENAVQTRSMSNLVREAARFSSKVRLISGAKTAALEEIRSVMGLNMHSGNTVTVEGKDEEAAVAAIQNYFVDNM